MQLGRMRMYETEKEIAMRVAAQVYDGPLKGGAVIRMHRFVELFMTEVVGSKCVDCSNIYMSRIDSQREQLEAEKATIADLRAYCGANPVVVSDEDIIARKEWRKKLLRSE